MIPDEGESPPTEADLRMAELLADGVQTQQARRRLREEGSAMSDDLLARLDALDYLSSVVGEVGGDVPERLGDYRISGLLGRGGMGTVYEAFQESLERIVALKVLSPALTADLGMRRRFRTEARASASLHHQHIVPVYGFGEAGGLLYFTMERVYGTSLDRHIARARRAGRPADPRETARRFAGVADALSHAHRRGILHRDIKPGNILVHPDGSFALADFGLSKIAGDASVSMSRTGSFLGTLHYASPEQARGQEVTPASDLYSLGVTLYEALTCRLPYSATTPQAMLQAVMNAPARRLRDALPKAPRDLDAVLRKLLQKEPGDRYADGEDLARDLLRVADGEPVRVRRQSPFVLLWRQVRKHPALSSAILLVAILLALVLGLWRSRAAERHQNLLNAAVAAAESEPGEPNGPAGLLIALGGMAIAGEAPPSDVPRLLELAERVGRDAGHAVELQRAYAEDPVPEATRLLLTGRGLEARAMLDRRIAEDRRSGFTNRNAPTWLRLFRLYLARAVACLTAAVGDPAAAGDDLLRASFVRPGAFAPAALGAILDWDERDGVPALAGRLDGITAELPEQYHRAVAGLVLAFAGLDRPQGANLMRFDLRYRTRRALRDWALQRLGERWSRVPLTDRTTRAGRLDASLAAAVAGAIRATEGAARTAALADARGLIAAVATGSALRAWQCAIDVAADSGRITDVVRASELPVVDRIRGLVWLLDLGPPRELAAGLRPVVGELREEAGDSVALTRLTAWCEARVGDPDAAAAAARRWVEQEPDDPEPYLCRFLIDVRRGDVQWAAVDADMAWQSAAEPRLVSARLRDLLAGYGAGHDGDGWAMLRRTIDARCDSD